MMRKAELDPIELEIAWGQLVAIIDEAALILVQTAFSRGGARSEGLHYRPDGY